MGRYNGMLHHITVAKSSQVSEAIMSVFLAEWYQVLCMVCPGTNTVDKGPFRAAESAAADSTQHCRD